MSSNLWELDGYGKVKHNGEKRYWTRFRLSGTLQRLAFESRALSNWLGTTQHVA